MSEKGEGTVSRFVTVTNSRGLHARAAARFVKTAEAFVDAEIMVSHRGIEVSGRSIMGLMVLAASKGCTIELKASGLQAMAALDALLALIEAKFNED